MDSSSSASSSSLSRGRRGLAVFISLAGHPFLLAPVTTLVVGWRAFGGPQTLRGVLTIVLACLAPAGIYIGRKVQTGEWSDLDVSARKDRPHLFALGLTLLALTSFILAATHQPLVFTRGCVGAMLLLVTAWVSNRWLKPSMHTGFVVLTAGALWRFDLPLALILALFAMVVGWSRIVLARHTVPEVLTGYLLALFVVAVVF
ncbi:MAG: phosphatase PAP2 family protein [Verrucomicrobia bacterium]|nr:phosphatase PAP2 family protein [Verrucomicrobiota bacterium]